MMPITLGLLLLLGAVGAWDVGWYHLIKLRLYSRCMHKYEQLAHLLRGLLYVAMIAGASLVELRGAMAKIWLGLFAVDFLNTLADTFFERDSRKAFGGVSHGEYIVHVCGSVLSGCAAVAAYFESLPLRAMPDLLELHAFASLEALQCAGAAMAALTLLVWVCEFSLTFRAALMDKLPGEGCALRTASPAGAGAKSLL